jgi:hypothetical protein
MLNRIDRILIPSMYTFFSESSIIKNSEVKCAWSGIILRWVTDQKFFSNTQKFVEKTSADLWG